MQRARPAGPSAYRPDPPVVVDGWRVHRPHRIPHLDQGHGARLGHPESVVSDQTRAVHVVGADRRRGEHQRVVRGDPRLTVPGHLPGEHNLRGVGLPDYKVHMVRGPVDYRPAVAADQHVRGPLRRSGHQHCGGHESVGEPSAQRHPW